MHKNDFHNKIKQKFYNTLFGLKENIPIIVGVLLLISMIKYSPLIKFLQWLNDNFFSVVFSDIIWSIAAWNPINSYIITSQLWDFNWKIVFITTFLIARVTVGFLQIPAEVYFFGKKFTFVRNLVSFVIAIVAWYVVAYLFNFIT